MSIVDFIAVMDYFRWSDPSKRFQYDTVPNLSVFLFH